MSCSGSAGSILIDPATTSTLYAPNDVGVFKSTNGGIDWTPASTGLPSGGKLTITLTIDPVKPSTLYAFIQGGGNFGSNFKSTDGATTWTAISTPKSSPIIVDPANSSTLYQSWDGVMKSIDGGAHWQNITPPAFITGPRYKLVIDPTSANSLYAALMYAGPLGPSGPDGPYGIGMFHSTNGGAGWTTMNTGWPLIKGLPGQVAHYPTVTDLAITFDGSTLYASTDFGLFFYTSTKVARRRAVGH